MDFQTHILPNGLRLIHKQVPSIAAHCGIIINAGSRDELPKEHGLAHFIEHVIFKGTKTRKSYHIINRIENVGGEINAYTSKELTCLYTSFLRDSYNRVLELMGDIICHSTFPEKEINREKQVILDEVNSYKDTPSELIFDDFEEYLFKGHSIGRNILGTKKSVNSFNKDSILNFIQRNYHPGEMVLSSVGNISFKRFIKLAEKHFCKPLRPSVKKQRKAFAGYQPFDKRIHKKTYQTHCIIGNTAYSIHDDQKHVLSLLNNLMGGPALNSRLNIALREKNGFTYNIESNYIAYTDTGQFEIYFSTDKGHLEKSLELVRKELKLMRTKKMGTLQLSRAKRQMIGQMAIAEENNEHRMLAAGKKFLLLNELYDLNALKNTIENISASELMEVANDVFNDQQLSVLVYK